MLLLLSLMLSVYQTRIWAHLHYAIFFLIATVIPLIATNGLYRDSMEVFTLCDCDNITNSYPAHYKQKQIAVANRKKIRTVVNEPLINVVLLLTLTLGLNRPLNMSWKYGLVFPFPFWLFFEAKTSAFARVTRILLLIWSTSCFPNRNSESLFNRWNMILLVSLVLCFCSVLYLFTRLGVACHQFL